MYGAITTNITIILILITDLKEERKQSWRKVVSIPKSGLLLTLYTYY
jgi:hypothetical protein